MILSTHLKYPYYQTEKQSLLNQPTISSSVSTNQQLLRAFDNQDKMLFFKLWLPPKDSDGVMIEFNCMIYFSVYPMHESNPNKSKELLRQEMTNLKQYLEQRSEVLANANILTFYALPYVQDPMSHPSFAHLFRVKWASDLRKSLSNYLSIKSPNNIPVLYELYYLYEQSKDENDNDTKIRQEKMYKESIIENNNKWMSISNNILQIAKDLLDTLKKVDSDRKITGNYIDHYLSRIEKYDRILNCKDDITESNINTSQIDTLSALERLEEIIITPLDFTRLKEYMQMCTDATVLYNIIYEIRYRLTHSHKGPQRNYVLLSYITNDIFGIEDKSNVIIDKFITRSQVRYK